jgi:hypothetical protein
MAWPVTRRTSPLQWYAQGSDADSNRDADGRRQSSVKYLKLARDACAVARNVPVMHATLGWTGVEAHTSTPQHAA